VWEQGRWRWVGLGEGAMDYAPFLRALAEVNYGGYVSVEWFGPEPNRAAETELAYLRQHLGCRLEMAPVS